MTSNYNSSSWKVRLSPLQTQLVAAVEGNGWRLFLTRVFRLTPAMALVGMAFSEQIDGVSNLPYTVGHSHHHAITKD
jgi:hypothetical protein